MAHCGICKNVASPDKEITCDFCKDVVHTTCSQLSRGEIQCLRIKDRKISYYCPNCDNLKAQVAQLGDLKKMVSGLAAEVQSLREKKSGNSESVDGMFSPADFFEEVNERNRRKNNVVILDVPESQAITKEKQREDDVSTVVTLLSALNDVGDPVHVRRLGAPLAGKIRPILVTLKCEESVQYVLRNKRKVANVRIFKDQTPLQRSQYRDLKAELDKLHNSGQKNKVIRYVNGVPKIVTKN